MYEQLGDSEDSGLCNQPFFLDRRDFLAALAATTAAGLLGLTGCSSSPRQADDSSPFGTPTLRPGRQQRGQALACGQTLNDGQRTQGTLGGAEFKRLNRSEVGGDQADAGLTLVMEGCDFHTVSLEWNGAGAG